MRARHGAINEAVSGAGASPVLEERFFHSLGHEVGLEVHEAPTLERAPDVLAVSAVARRPIHASPLSGRCRPEFTP